MTRQICESTRRRTICAATRRRNTQCGGPPSCGIPSGIPIRITVSGMVWCFDNRCLANTFRFTTVTPPDGVYNTTWPGPSEVRTINVNGSIGWQRFSQGPPFPANCASQMIASGTSGMSLNLHCENIPGVGFAVRCSIQGTTVGFNGWSSVIPSPGALPLFLPCGYLGTPCDCVVVTSSGLVGHHFPSGVVTIEAA